MAYYDRGSSDYKELENHSDQVLQLQAWTTRFLLVTGCNYSYIAELLTAEFYQQHMIDVVAVNGPGHARLRHLLRNYKSQSRAINYIRKVHPDYYYLVDDLNITTEKYDAVTTRTRKNGCRSTTIMNDYDMKITAKHVTRQRLLQP